MYHTIFTYRIIKMRFKENNVIDILTYNRQIKYVFSTKVLHAIPSIEFNKLPGIEVICTTANEARGKLKKKHNHHHHHNISPRTFTAEHRPPPMTFHTINKTPYKDLFRFINNRSIIKHYCNTVQTTSNPSITLK